MRTPPSSFSAVLGGFVLAASAAASAQVVTADGQWSDEFDRPGLEGRVFGLGTWNGKLYAGGHALAGDGADLTHFAEFDGVRWRKVGGGIPGDVRDFTVFEDDLVVAGSFGVVGDPFVPVSGVARWDGANWQAFGQGFKLFGLGAEVWAVEVYQGELYAGGYFDSADGKPISILARWDGVTWQPVGGGLSGSFEPKVLDLHATTDGKLVVAGEFDTAGGQPARNVAVWDGSSWSTLGSGLGNHFSSVFALEEFDGKLYATGNFKTAGGVAAEKIAAWDGSSWSPLGSGLPDWDISVTGYALEEFGGALYVGGNFISAGGVPSSRVVRWTGTHFEGLGGVAGTDLKTTAIAMTTWTGKLVVGGEFTVAGTDLYPGNGIASESVVAFDGSEWSHLGDGLGFDGGAGVLIEWKGEMLAAGGFLTAGTTNSVGMASFDGTGWEPVAFVLGGQVKDAVLFEDDLVVVGSFKYIDGQPLSGVCRLDGTSGTWSVMPGGGGDALEVHEGKLYVAGLGSPRVWNGSSFVQFGSPIAGQAYDMHSHDGVLYIGGSYPFSAGNLWGWDGTTLEVVGGGTNGAIHALDTWQGDLIVGGEFDTAGGVLARRLARWDGSAFHPFGNGQLFTGFGVQSLYVFQGDLYLGGDLFTGTSPYDYIAKWDATDGLQALETGGPLNRALNSPARAYFGDAANGRLYVAGGFSEAGGMPSHGLARWDIEPASFQALGGAVTGSTGEPELAGSGTLAASELFAFTTSKAPPLAPAFLVIGFSELSLPFGDGALVPMPVIVGMPHATTASGTLSLQMTWPAGMPAGLQFWSQVWMLDPAGAYGLAATNALLGTAK